MLNWRCIKMNKFGLDPRIINIDPLKNKIQSDLKGIKKQGTHDKKRLKKVCKEFEALFIEKLWKEMKKTVSQSGLFNDPISNKYLEMFDYTFAMQLAKDGGIGLGNFLYNNLVKQLEQKSKGICVEKDINSSTYKRQKIDNTNIQQQVDTLARKIEESDEAKTIEKIDLPVAGEITSRFGWRRDPFFGDIRWHNGVDIAAPIGTPIKSVINGRVIFSGQSHGYGNLVIIEDPNGTKTYYAHNEENLVKQGQYVKKGEVIARVGESGRATGPHVHFEVRINNKPIDPLKLAGPFYATYLKSHKG